MMQFARTFAAPTSVGHHSFVTQRTVPACTGSASFPRFAGASADAAAAAGAGARRLPMRPNAPSRGAAAACAATVGCSRGPLGGAAAALTGGLVARFQATSRSIGGDCLGLQRSAHFRAASASATSGTLTAGAADDNDAAAAVEAPTVDAADEAAAADGGGGGGFGKSRQGRHSPES